MMKEIDSKRSKFKKNTCEYTKDNVLDIIDIEGTLSKNRFIPKAPLHNFNYSSDIKRITQNPELTPTSDTLPEISSILSSKINFSKLNKNKFKIDFSTLLLHYPNNYSIKFTKSYYPISIIGQGSFGLVISAVNIQDKSNYEKLAVKIIDKTNFNENDKTFLENEVRIWRKCDNNRILKVYEVWDTDQYFFIFMELIEGGSLRDLIVKRYLDEQQNYLFRDNECSMIMEGILDAVNYWHSQRIVHRDIKPENIMFKNKDDLNSIVLCDFGMAFQWNGTTKDISGKCGTWWYMSPEIINKKNYDYLTDSWSCGIIWYLLTSGGEHPLYVNGMSQSKYEEKIIKKEKFNFVQTMPLLARNLCLKLCKYDVTTRYYIAKAKKHPWITRSIESKIPLTLWEEYQKVYKIESFKSLISATLFFSMFKSIFHLTAKPKPPVSNVLSRINSINSSFNVLNPSLLNSRKSSNRGLLSDNLSNWKYKVSKQPQVPKIRIKYLNWSGSKTVQMNKSNIKIENRNKKKEIESVSLFNSNSSVSDEDTSHQSRSPGIQKWNQTAFLRISIMNSKNILQKQQTSNLHPNSNKVFKLNIESKNKIKWDGNAKETPRHSESNVNSCLSDITNSKLGAKRILNTETIKNSNVNKTIMMKNNMNIGNSGIKFISTKLSFNKNTKNLHFYRNTNLNLNVNLNADIKTKSELTQKTTCWRTISTKSQFKK